MNYEAADSASDERRPYSWIAWSRDPLPFATWTRDHQYGPWRANPSMRVNW